ncbi:putative ribonuclease H-like domain-containing protein [Tanacetum coccineum]
MNLIKHDVVLGRMKFVNKGEDNQRYGMSIPDLMVNIDIKNSKAYQSYLSISTRVVIPKKARKGIKTPATPKKNVTENPTSDESNDEEEGRLTQRRPTGVIIRDTLNVSMKKTLDLSKKLKGGDITLEVPDEPKGKFIAQDIDWGSDEEEIILSIDDKRTESETAVAETEKSNEETSDDDEMRSDKRLYTDEEMHDDEDVHDEDEKYVDADKEMHDVENADKVKDDQAMAETEKGVSKKTEEEKDHNLWDIIVNGDLKEDPAPTGDQSGPSATPVPKTAKQLAAKRNQKRAAIKSRFAGNEESKKMQKNVLKHQFENFTTTPNESLDKAYDRFHKLISQLEVHAAPVSKEDINQKFLRILPPSWSQIALIMRNKPDIDQTDIDDLYNNLRVYEDEMKRYSSSTSNSQNLAFLSSKNTSSISTASGNFGVNTAGGTSSTSQRSSTPCADEVMCSFFAQQTTSPQLENEDLQQIDEDDLEELDLRWQVAMLTVRVKKFIQKTGRNLDFKGKQPVSLDKSKVECYNCHRKGHFARECNSGRNQGKRPYGDNGRRNASTNEPSSQALVAQDGLGGYDWSHDFDEPVNYALMAISSSSSSSSSDNEVQNCSKQCLESFKTLQKNYDSEREKHNRARLEIQGYELALESLESRILGHEKNELAWGEKYEFQNYELKCRELKINNLNMELEKVVKERDELNIKIAKWEESSKSLNILLNSQMSAHDKNGLGYGTQLNEMSDKSETDSEISMSVFEVRSSDEESTPANDRFSKADGYHVVPPPITGNFLTPRADISFAGLDEYAIRKKIIESKTTELNADTSKSKTSETVGNTNEVNVEKPKSVNESVVSTPNINKDKVIIEDWNSDDEDDVSEVSPVKTNETQTAKTQVDKIGQTSKKAGIGFKKIKACFVCKSTDHLIKDCDFYDKKSPEPKLKNMVNTGQRVVKPVWDNAKRVNHQKISNKLNYPQARRTFVPSGVLTRTGLVNPVRPNEKRAVQTINTARSVSVVRPIYPRMDNGNPEIVLQDYAVVDSGCSSHMTGNKAYLSDYEDYNGGFVAFGCEPKGELNFKLLDESQVVLRASRQNDVYSLDLKNIVPSGGSSGKIKEPTQGFLYFPIHHHGVHQDEISNKSETDSEISMSVFWDRSSDEELTPANDSLDEYAIRKKIIKSKTTEPKDDTSESKTSETVGKTNEVEKSKTKINRDEVIIKDWNSNDKDDVSEVNTISPVKTNETQTVKTQVDKIGQISQKEGIGFKKIKACFVCKSTNHLIKDCDFYAKKSPEPKLKTVVNTGQRVVKLVWDNAKRVLLMAQRPAVRPKDLKQDVKTSGVKNMTTVGTRAVVNTGKGKMDNALKKSRWVWRPKGNYMDHESKEKGSFILKKFEYVDPKGISKSVGNPEILLQDHAVVDSGCSSHMTGNKAYLSDYEDFNGGFVAFGSDPKGGKITGKGKIKTANLDFDDVYFVDELKFNLFSVSQMCDKKNSVLFTESECLILSPSFKLLDESQVVLRAPRKDDVYSLDLKNIVPSGGITCLYANATADESKLWHRRLGHVNFKNINKLVKGHLVRGLPSKVFVNDHTCVACKKGKQHKASCKAKLDRIIRKPLELLHMDLFGPVSIESINKKRYCLVVTDDFSRFSWVFFLATKDETSEILCNLIIGLEKQLNHNVKIIRCDNGTEFKNYVMNEFCAKKGIKREFSVAKTPQQNGVIERKNRTLIEATRTMLADSLLPILFWAEAVNTACYVLNRVLVTKPQNKTPYELLIGKFDGKSDEGYLLGYSTSSKAFRVYNKRTKRVEENLHINFLEDQPNVAGTGSSGKDKGPTQEYILLPLQPHRTRIPVKDVVQDVHLYRKVLAPTLTKKLFANMKRGFAGDIVPLLPAMLVGAAMDQSEGSAQPAEPHPTPVDPIPSTSHSPPPSPQYQSPHHSPP